MQGMQTLQQSLVDQQKTKDRKNEGQDDEYLRGGVELHPLPEWAPESAPVDLQDWLLIIEAQMSDLSASSNEWWKLTLQCARDWYTHHQSLKPIEKLKHSVVVPSQLDQTKWKRLERRSSTLLLKAIPESQREDIIAGRDVSVLNILTRLMLNYQPGGSSEKAAVLGALELPAEAQSPAEAIAGLRRWLRWKKRAVDMGLVLPDPSVLLRGLDRMTTKVLSTNTALQFRVNLTRTTLLVDAVPTSRNIEQLAECLMAELDQLSYAKRKNQALQPPKIKKFEEEAKPEGSPPKKGDDGKRSPCKFFLTEDGCRRGKECKWSHSMQDPSGQKRCWTCGSTKHFSNKCTVGASPSPPKMSKAEKDKAEAKKAKGEEDEVQSNKAAIGPGEDMKSLLEEAGKILKSMPGSAEASEDGDAKIRSLQRQLDELRSGSLRVLRLARVQPCSENLGLLDSGATHALRPLQEGESWKQYSKVKINLAGGKQLDMRMSPGNVIVGAEDIEPIVPLGMMISRLACTLQWTEDHLVITHPIHGQIPTTLKDGCPMVTRQVALKLIEELEREAVGGLFAVAPEKHPLEDWLKRLIQEHPAFEGLPQEVKSKLIVSPREGHLVGNRRRRKLWKKEGGVTLYLYAGENKDYTYARAVKEAGGDPRKVIMVDIKNGSKWDMVEGGLYSQLMHMAMDGQITSVLTSPNCRTRSKLRHIQVPGCDLPGPARAWGGEEWGKKDNSSTEHRKCWEDDVMMFRALTIFAVAEEVRRAEKRTVPTAFLLEHPSEPETMPEVVSIWRTPQWRKFKDLYGLVEHHIDQGELSDGRAKPTTLGSNLDLKFPQLDRIQKKRREVEGKTGEEIVQQSKRMARWVPLMTSAIAEAVLLRDGVRIKVRAWRTHILQYHHPFHKGCRICQEAAGRGRPHYKQRLPPRAGVLSVDLAGPMKKQQDINRKYGKYLLVATVTWPKEGVEQEDPLDEEGKDEDPGPEIEEGEEGKEVGELKAVNVEDHDSEDSDQKEMEERRQTGVPANPDIEYEPSEPMEEVGPEEEVHMAVYRIMLPIPSKGGDDILKGLADITLTLRHEGIYVQQLHADRGGEFGGRKVEKWCLDRGIQRTYTAGVDPKGNGRVEKAVQVAKDSIRKTLLAAGVGAEFWPLAARHVNEAWRRRRMKSEEQVPPFMAPVLAKKRFWKAVELEAKNEQVKYLTPSWTDHGHWVLRQGGQIELTRSVIAKTKDPEDEDQWMALEEKMNEIEERRRIRGKSQVRRLQEVSEQRKEHEKRKDEVVRQEMVYLINDDPEVAAIVAVSMREFQGEGQGEDQEILQTKIVSPMEVRRKIEAWRPAIEAEIEALFRVKKALRLVEAEEMAKLIKEKKVIPLPSKVIFTIKPDAKIATGKKKCRIVACGNFAPQEDKGDYFAAGADSTSLRMALSMASRKQWIAINADVKTAFLNAPMRRQMEGDSEDEQSEEAPILLRPPGILVQLGFFSPSQGWAVDMALYGFRQSPKRWSDHRDHRLIRMKVGAYYLEQMESESCMWIIRKMEDEEAHGILLTYVDDLLILSSHDLAHQWMDEIRKEWETSQPEVVDKGSSTRFLGMEITKGHTGVWFASQEGYTRDLLQRRMGPDPTRWGHRKTPMGREEAEEEEEEEQQEGHEEKAAKVKEAQGVVGELIWLVTRCRPDIMYATSWMASLTTRRPDKVLKAAKDLWQYLAGTLKEGLVFTGEVNEDLMVYTDASFGEEDAHGCVVIKWGDDPILWRSSRQGLLTTSTAEAELVEIMEGAITAEATRVVLEEMMGKKMTCWQFTDSASGLAIVSGNSASWRTRHLRKRVKYLRWKTTRGEVILRHQPGAEMVADLGTKPLLTAKFRELKKKLGMKGFEDKMNHEKSLAKKEKDKASTPGKTSKDLLRLAVIMALVARTKGEEEEMTLGGATIYFEGLVLLYTLAVIAITLFLSYWCGGRTYTQVELEEEVLKKVKALGGSKKEDQSQEEENAPQERKTQVKAPLPFQEEEEEVSAEEAKEEPSASSSVSHVVRSSTVQANVEAATTVGRPDLLTGLYVAGGGRKYHCKRDCTGVKMSKNVHRVKLCQICLEKKKQWHSGITLYARNPGYAMHTCEAHFQGVWPTEEPIQYHPCQVCLPKHYG